MKTNYMKKITKYTLGFVALALSVFVSQTAHAQYSGNWNNDPKDPPTIQIMNATRNPGCNFAQCGSTSVTANTGDLVSVQIYYHNTGSNPEQAILNLSPRTSGSVNTLSFIGGVNGRNGSATLTINGGSQPVEYIGVGRFYQNQSATPQTGDYSQVFSGGFNAGNIAASWSSQGTLVLDFRVGVGSTNTGFACSDGIDNDGDGRIDMNDAGCFGPTDNDEYNSISNSIYGCTDRSAINYNPSATINSGCVYTQSGNLPTVSTTVATNVGQNSARLNGIVFSNNYQATSWFEWGDTRNLGNTTSQTSLGTSSNYPTSDFISGLRPNTVYFFRAVAQNQYGVARGSIVQFKTLDDGSAVVVDTQTRYIVRNQVIKTNLSAGVTTPSLFGLRIENRYTNACIGDNLEYSIRFDNVSTKTVTDTVLQVIIPSEMTFVKSSQGTFDTDTNTLTVNVGVVNPGESKEVFVNVKMNTSAKDRDFVLTARLMYTNPQTGAQEDVLGYSFLKGLVCNNTNLLGASALFSGSFFPTTLVGWLLLILLVLLLIFISRNLYEKTYKKKRTEINITQ